MRYLVPLILLFGGCCCCTVGPGDQQQLREDLKIVSYSDASSSFDDWVLPACENLADEFGGTFTKGSIRPSVRPNTDFEMIVSFTKSESGEELWKAVCQLHYQRDRWVYIDSDISPADPGTKPSELCQVLKKNIEQAYGSRKN